MAKHKREHVHKVHNCLNGETYHGHDCKLARRLDARIRSYEAYIQSVKGDGGKGFKKPGSLRK